MYDFKNHTIEKMGIVLDLIVVAIILLNLYVCYKKGLVNLAVGLIAVAAAIIISLLLYKPVSNMIIENTQIDENIENFIVEKFEKDVPEGAEVRYTGVLEYIEKYTKDAITEKENELVYTTSKVIAVKAINVTVLLALYIIARTLLFVLTFVADIITSLPLLKQLDDIGGIVFGLLKGLLIVYVIFAILFFIVGITGNTWINEAIQTSYISKLFYEHNILLNIIF